LESAWLWSRRNPRLAASFAGLLAMVCVLGILVAMLTAARRRAEANLAEAMSAVDEFLSKVGDEKLADIPQLEPVRIELLTAARRRLERLLESNAQNPALRLEIAKGWRSLGRIDRLLHNTASSARSYQESIRQLEALSREAPAEAVYQFELGDSLHWQAVLWAQAGDERALRVHDRSIEIQRQLHERHATQHQYAQHLARSLYSRGTVFRRHGKLTEAQADYREAIGLLKPLAAQSGLADRQACRQELARCDNNLANVFQEQGNPAKAEEHFRRAIDALRELPSAASSLGNEPRSVKLELAQYHINLTNLLKDRETPEASKQAIDHSQEAVRLLAEFAQPLPKVRYERANAQHTQGALHSIQEPEKAKALFLEVQRELEALEPLYANNPQFWDRRGNAHYELGQIAYWAEKPDLDAASQRFGSGVECHRRACELAPGNREYFAHLIAGVHLYGFCCLKGAKPPGGMSDRLLPRAKGGDVAWASRILIAWKKAIDGQDEKVVSAPSKAKLREIAQRTIGEMLRAAKAAGRLSQAELKAMQAEAKRGSLPALSE
jgi:tetratricopeptide (TPR) repeat protein